MNGYYTVAEFAQITGKDPGRKQGHLQNRSSRVTATVDIHDVVGMKESAWKTQAGSCFLCE